MRNLILLICTAISFLGAKTQACDMPAKSYSKLGIKAVVDEVIKNAGGTSAIREIKVEQDLLTIEVKLVDGFDSKKCNWLNYHVTDDRTCTMHAKLISTSPCEGI